MAEKSQITWKIAKVDKEQKTWKITKIAEKRQNT